ncbi:TPA: hypothetical protein OMS23_004611, partial [Enterobacter hormaechei]|nr:hypothetical protein [Enterobacter hormaechei]
DEDGRASYTELELQKVRNDIAKGTYSDHHRRYFEEEALGSRQTAQVELERAAVDSLPYIHSDEDGVLYRGVSMPSDELKRLHAGGTIQNSQLSFFSSSRAVARSFATLQNQVAGNVPVIFKIRGIPSGIFHKGLKGGAAYASMFDMFGLNGLSRNAMREEISASTEAVLPPGHMFSITSIKHGDSSITSFKRAWTGFKASVPAFLGTRMTRLRHRLNIGSYQNRVAPLMASKERAHKIAGTMFTTHMTPGKLSFADPVKNVTRITISYSGYSQRKNITATSHFL